ncbi:MAG: DNA polymerase III subunit beta [Syntrophothermus sp.]|uniref:DNA polymerase III subunit beta n=1 Tax=Syntrophothermus sp. TaxID=2736299 RepID=UPI00257CC65F|nr:DNA polymerase III subunit beta [Syntrophothermus sp.]NSW83522.1 DNA polymerase III subunit beta [Syntrophothermus sp.]
MKFSINQPELARVAALVQRAASTRETVPVLSGLLLKASATAGLSMTCTDLEIALSAHTLEANVIEEGTALVNARYFADLVRYLPNIEIQVFTDDENSRLTVNYGRSQTHLHLYNPQEFPETGRQEPTPLLSVSQKTLKELLRKTSFAAAVNHFKQVFTGVLFDFTPDQLRVVASDTHRLAMMSFPMSSTHTEPRQLVIPSRTVAELIRILDDSEKEVSCGLAGNNIVFTCEEPGFQLTSRLLEGQYPNYLPVIPGNFVSTVKLEPGPLANALERAVLMPTDKQSSKQPIRHVTLELKDRELRVSAYSQKMGELQEVLEDISVEGESNVQISFNTRYLLDVIKVLQGECTTISLKFTGSLSPALIQDPCKDDYLYVLVPLITH